MKWFFVLTVLLISHPAYSDAYSYKLETQAKKWILRARALEQMNENGNPESIQIFVGDAWYWPRKIINIEFEENAKITVKKAKFLTRRARYLKHKISFKSVLSYETSIYKAVNWRTKLLEKTANSRRVYLPYMRSGFVCMDGPSYYAIIRTKGEISEGVLEWCGYKDTHNLVCEISTGERCEFRER